MAELERLVGRYREVLSDDLGFTVRSVDEATLAFETADLNLLVFLEDRDPEYLHLVAIFPPPELDLDEAELVRMCNQVTKEAKVAKVVADEDGDLIVSAEMIVAGTDLMPSRAHLASVLPRAISAVFNAVGKITMSLELHGISQAVYDGAAGDLDGLGLEDPPKHGRTKRQHRRKPQPSDEDDAGD
jgi:hypothetical protein